MNYVQEIKAVVFDFDGTLIDFNYQTTDYTRIALKKLKENGYKVCLSSGRPCFLAKKAFENTFGEYPLDYIFGCNGSEMMDVKNDDIQILFPLSADDVKSIGKLLDNEILTLGIYEGSKFLVNKSCDSKDIKDWLEARWLTPIVYDFSLNDKPRSKVLALNDKADRPLEDELLKTIYLSNYSAAYSSLMCFEIAPKGVNKAKSIERLAEILGCSNSQILSFGDMPNDLPMLLNSTGVVMDNASDDMKAKVSLHTSAVDKMGVYEFLHNNGLI